MSKRRGAKGKSKEDIAEEEMYRQMLAEERANDAALPCFMDRPSGDWQ